MISTLRSHLPLSGAMKSLGTGTALLLLVTGSPALAAVNLIDNPDFTATGSSTRTTQTQLNVASDAVVPGTPAGLQAPAFSAGANIAPWTVSGLAFLFGPNSISLSGTNADISPGAANHFAPSPPTGFCLYGPGSCGLSRNNGLTIGPSGGNFVALDGALTSANTPPLGIRAELSQTLTGLEVGIPVMIEFEWAAAQQAHFVGPTTEQLDVSLGGETQSTPTVSIPEAGFHNWMPEEFTFIPTMSSEVLSFLAIGTPEIGLATGGPPFVLLDGGVEAREVPELSTWAMMALGFAGLAYAGFRSNRRKPAWSA
jgi:hypothetical protein